MKKQTKNILKRSDIEKEMREANRIFLRSDLLSFFSLFLITVPLSCLFIYSFFQQAFHVFGVVSLLCGLFIFAPNAYFAIALFRGIQEKKLLDQGAWGVECDYVTQKTDGEMRYRYRVVKVLYFSKHRKHEVDSTIFECTDLGDEFYIVVLHGRKRIEKSIYPCKLYEWKED